jgi:hypothetical protein
VPKLVGPAMRVVRFLESSSGGSTSVVNLGNDDENGFFVQGGIRSYTEVVGITRQPFDVSLKSNWRVRVNKANAILHYHPLPRQIAYPRAHAQLCNRRRYK